LAIAKWRGMSVLTWLAQNQNWYNMGLWRSDVAIGLKAGDVEDLLDELVERLPDIQAIHLLAQPKSWDGFPNPFARIDHTLSPVRTYAFACGPGSAGHAKLTGGRAHFNKKVRRLAKLGGAAFEMVEDEAVRISAINRFFDWKAERLAALGLRNGFSCPAMRAFHRELARRSESKSALRVEGLRVATELVSVALSLRFKGRQYYLNSAFDPSPDILQHSPGLLIAENMFAHSVNEDVVTIDYGPGESPEKMKWGVSPTPLFETYRSVSARGWGPTMRRRLSSQVVRFVRGMPELHGLLRQLSRGLRRFNSVGVRGI
jgi:CelD/BcsL family acetyltransferase involved in cellulose biosynthesis